MSELGYTGSRLIDGMGPEYWGDSPRQAEVLEIGDFIEQWIQVKQRGDTVLVSGFYTGNDHGPIYALNVSDWSLQKRTEISDSIRERTPLLAHDPEQPKGPIERRAAEERVGAVLDAMVRTELYAELSRSQKLVQILRYLRGEWSLYPNFGARMSAIPDYIFFASDAIPDGVETGGNGLILVNGESEKAYTERTGKFGYW